MQDMSEHNPTSERQLHLELRKEEFKATIKSWIVCTGAMQYDALLPEERDFLTANRILTEDCIETRRQELERISANIESAALILGNAVSTLEAALLKTRSLVESQQYQEALQEQIRLRDTLIIPIEREVKIITRCIRSRLEPETSVESRVIDIVSNHFFQPIIDSCLQRQMATGGRRSMAPLALLFHGNEALGTHRFQQYPFDLIPINHEDLNAPWTLIKLFGPVADNLYTALRIDSDIIGLVNRLSRIHNLHHLTAQMLSLGRISFVTELAATMLGGPAYLSAAIETSANTLAHVADPRLNPHKVPLLFQWHACCSVLDMIGMSQESRTLRSRLFATYGTPDTILSLLQANPSVAELFQYSPSIAHAMLTTPLHALGGATLLKSLPTFTPTAYQKALEIKQVLCSTETPHDSDYSRNAEEHLAHLEFNDPDILLALLTGCRLAFEEISRTDTSRYFFTGSHKAFLSNTVRKIISSLPDSEPVTLNSIEDIAMNFHWNDQLINTRIPQSAVSAFHH